MNKYIKKMQQLDLVRKKELHPEWIWNRSDTHVFLSQPGASDVFKTVVEPGNCFSPGVGTYGVSAWISTENGFFAPEQADSSFFRWQFEDLNLPILHCGYTFDNVAVSSRLFSMGDNDTLDYTDYFSVTLRNESKSPIDVIFYLTLRSFGAAGGPVYSIDSNERSTCINQCHVIYHDKAHAFHYVRYSQANSDIGEYLRNGSDVPYDMGTDQDGWASGALEYRVKIMPEREVSYQFAFHKFEKHRNLYWLKSAEDEHIQFGNKMAKLKSKWLNLSGIKINVPDKRFAKAIHYQILHLYMSSVNGSPRISPVTYPIWWHRDACYQIIALEKIGLRVFTDTACDIAISKPSTTGFGAEGDGAGELIWILSEHYLMTKDAEFLKKAYPVIKERAEKILQMSTSDKPTLENVEFVTFETALNPDLQVMAGPSLGNGLVNGRMDMHYPIFYVNSFCYLGLMRAAICAEVMGDTLAEERYRQSASDFKGAMERLSKTEFGNNERDTCTAIWPSHWADPDNPAVAERFEHYWNNKWCPDGVVQHEPLWTYFEVGDAHSRIFLNQRDRAWEQIGYFLEHHTSQGLFTWHEGDDDENSCLLNWEKIRGWDKSSYVTPHGWTSSEILSCLRDCLVYEHNGELKLGAGIPDSWLDSDFSVENLPTWFGPISYFYKVNSNTLMVFVSSAEKHRIRNCFPRSTVMQLESLK